MSLISMKLFLVLLVAAVLLPSALAAQNPVVVELFTSEGCSSCPPADALLLKLSQLQEAGGEVIVLGEHVDYWNYIGWTDRFSSHQLTLRQQSYAQRFGLASPYTPQMVIDGQQQVLGSDASAVAHDIDAASKKNQAATVTVAKLGGNSYQVSVKAENEKAKVYVAVTEDKLSSEVKGGENGGRTIHHAGVVRELRPIGSLTKGEFQKKVDVSLQRDWNSANLKLIVFVQQGDSGPILGATSLRLNQ
jgi:hypothetical protein